MVRLQYALVLPYTTPGDDLAVELFEDAARANGLDTSDPDWVTKEPGKSADIQPGTADHGASMRALAERLEVAAFFLRQIANAADNEDLEVIVCDGDLIEVECEEALGEKLIEQGFLDYVEDAPVVDEEAFMKMVEAGGEISIDEIDPSFFDDTTPN